MTKYERKLFTEKVEKIFEIMKSMPPPPQEWMNKVQVVDNIGQTSSSFIHHRLMFIRHDQSEEMRIRHDVFETRDGIEKHMLFEGYNFHPKRKNKFDLTSICSGQTHIKLFDRWSKIDVEDLLRKMDLKMVELI